MRWMLVAALVALSPVPVSASDPIPDYSLSVVDVSEAAPGVTISAIPAPFPVIEVLKLDAPGASLRSAKKQRLAKKKTTAIMMLSRTERRQLELLSSSTKAAGPTGHSYNRNEDFQSGLDELDFHRSYSRPKLIAESFDNADDSPGLSPEIRLRLLISRLKAVEAHALNQVKDNGEALPEGVRQRLQEARMKAVRAHQEKFS